MFDRITEHHEDLRTAQESPIWFFHDVLRAPDQPVGSQRRVDFRACVGFKIPDEYVNSIIVEERVGISVQTLKNT
ncbi:hypothetical protein OAL64_00190 [bacterium]|nr:hypothetical protein [bacterium]